MWQNRLSAAFLALATASNVLGQSTTSSNPLNEFISGVNSVAGILSSASASAAATRSSSSSSSSTPTAASSSSPSATQASPTSSPSAAAAASHHGSNHKTLIIAVVCAVVGAILLALIFFGICCCLVRRRRRQRKNRAVTPVGDDEIHAWKSEKPQNPGRSYIPSQYGRIPSGEHEPMVPPMAAGGNPAIGTHPAHRPENPFVPVVPTPRRSAPNSRSGLTDATVPGDVAYVEAAGDPEKQRLRSRSRSHSRSRPSTGTGIESNGLPTHANADRPPTPFGLMGLGQPYAGADQRNSGAGQPYGGIGQPYEDMHVHVLQHDAPSQALRQSLNDRDPLASAQLRTPTPGFSTPPDVPNRSPRRSGQFTDSPYTTASDTASSSTASDEYRASYAPGISIPPGDQQPYSINSPYSHRLNYDPQFIPQKMQQPQQNTTLPQSQFASRTAPNDHYSTSPTAMPPPPVPWSEPTENRRQSPTRASGQWSESGRRASRSPATSINGQPRRLRFSDLQASPTGYGGWDERYGTSSQARGGVGEAM
ncbi:MAG: hypothetical protein Q9195_002279 [Heterodermia aff. obscurata]